MKTGSKLQPEACSLKSVAGVGKRHFQFGHMGGLSAPTQDILNVILGGRALVRGYAQKGGEVRA
jgi:hypothetical protein